MANAPNIIWFMADQHRSQALSRHGDPNVSTPNLDMAAASGLDFTRAVSGFPLCCPFRGSLLSSLYPHKCVPGHEYRLDPALPLVTDVFRQNGYCSAYFGKWHLDGFKEKDGRAAFHTVPRERRGRFDVWLGYENNNSPFDSWVHGHGTAGEVERYRLPGYETDEIVNLGLRFVEEQAELRDQGKASPFFMVLSVQPPHNPYVAPPAYMRRHNPAQMEFRPNVPAAAHYRRQAGEDLAGYCAMVENIDHNFGRLQEALRKRNLSDNTHILYFSDHGDMLQSHGQRNKTRPYEESMRVPFIISGEAPFSYGGRKSGRSDALVNHVDIAPTSLGLCGLAVPDWMEGYDYSHLRLGHDQPTRPEPESAFLQSVIPTGNPDSLDRPWRGVVTRDGWKYACFESLPWLLFDLNTDPYEQANLAHNNVYYPKQRELLALLRDWLAKTGDAFALPEV